MNKLFQNMIESLLETRNLQISNKNFSTEAICGERLNSSSFKNLSFFNFNLNKVQNCIFDITSFQDAEFENCNLINCQIRNWN